MTGDELVRALLRWADIANRRGRWLRAAQRRLTGAISFGELAGDRGLTK